MSDSGTIFYAGIMIGVFVALSVVTITSVIANALQRLAERRERGYLEDDAVFEEVSR